MSAGGERDVCPAIDNHPAACVEDQSESPLRHPAEFRIGEILLPDLDEVDAPGRKPADAIMKSAGGQLPPVRDVIIKGPVSGESGSWIPF